MASQVVLVQGTSIKISETPVTELSPSPMPDMISMDCISKEITYQGGTADEIETTTICSTAKEFRLGLEDPGTMSITGHWVQSHPAHAVIRQAARDKETRLIEVLFNDGSIFRALALVSQRAWSAAVSGVVSATFSFRLTGDVLEIDASGA